MITDVGKSDSAIVAGKPRTSRATVFESWSQSAEPKGLLAASTRRAQDR